MSKESKVHIEQPMFSRNMLCGLSGKGLHHTWPLSPDAVKDVTCRKCKSLFLLAVRLTASYYRSVMKEQMEDYRRKHGSA